MTAAKSTINPTNNAATVETTKTSKKVRRMFGLSLQGWENWMVASLIVAAAFALIAGFATWQVVRLQRIELADSKNEFDRYKLDTEQKIADANERTARSQAELARFRIQAGARQINGVKFKELSGGKPKATVEIVFLKGNEEVLSLVYWLLGALKGAQWEVSEPRPVEANELIRMMPQPSSFGAAGVIPTGINITIRGDTPDDLARFQFDNKISMLGTGGRPTPLNTLSSAISGSLAGGGWVGTFMAMSPQVDAPPSGVLRVLIGPKS